MEHRVPNVNHLYLGQNAKTCLQGFVKNTGADQPAHLRSLISAFGMYHVPVAEETCLKLALSEASKTDFLKSRPM